MDDFNLFIFLASLFFFGFFVGLIVSNEVYIESDDEFTNQCIENLRQVQVERELLAEEYLKLVGAGNIDCDKARLAYGSALTACEDFNDYDDGGWINFS